MTKTIFLCATLLAVATAAQAAPAPAPAFAKVQPLLSGNSCLACHSVEQKVVGPAYKDVAAKYKGRADAAAYLSKKIKGGSTGVWGEMVMPPNTGVNDADLKTIVDWLVAGASMK
jgi:cytochrome c551/c552